MKHWLLLIGLIFLGSLFFPAQDENSPQIYRPVQERVTNEQTPDIPQKLEILSKDLKGCSFLTPRRAFQTFSYNSPVRLIRQAVKLLQIIRIKGDQQLQKINEFNTYCQTLNFSSLLCCRGYHIYALQKLLI